MAAESLQYSIVDGLELGAVLHQPKQEMTRDTTLVRDLAFMQTGSFELVDELAKVLLCRFAAFEWLRASI